jgi:translocation and assembly module TamB
VERISQPDVNISLVQLNAKGNEKQHDLQLRVQGDPVSGQLRWRAASTAKRSAGRDADNTRSRRRWGRWR